MADSTEQSAAAQLLQQHLETASNAGSSHRVLVEEVEDEDLHKPVSSSETPAAPKPAPKPKTLDTQSRELFPELGGPKPKASVVAPIWGAKNNANGSTNGAAPANGTPQTSAPPSGVSTPIGSGRQGPGPHPLSIPGRNVETMLLDPPHILPRTQLKRPLPDILKDLNRKARANVTMHALGNGQLRFDAVGPQEHATQALKDLINQIGTKQNITVGIPSSARAHIIGKGGSTIKAIQEKTGARIQLPKSDESHPPADEDDDTMINVHVEGNAFSAAAAKQEIEKIAGERAANVQTKLRNIPAEFYPFIAGPKNDLVHKLEEDLGVQIRVPPLQGRSLQTPVVPAPGQRPIFAPAPQDYNIQLAGERTAVQNARAAIERRAEELRRQLALEQLSIQHGRHQFIIGDRGVPLDQFFEDTGCAIILPSDEDDDMVTIIGPQDHVNRGLDKAMDLAMNMQCSNIDISRFHRQAPGGAAAHARSVTRYLRQRKAIEQLERLHNVQVNTPYSDEGALPWELYARDGKNAIRAQSEIKGLVDSHPPARIQTVQVDPFFHTYIRKDITPRVRQDYRVQLVVPETTEANAPVLLVYEGPSSPTSYEIPRGQPSQSEVSEMQKWLQDARQHILGLVNQQEEIIQASLDVPIKYHTKLRNFIRKEQDERRSQEKIPARVSNIGTTVNIKGPRSAVENLASKCEAFIEQEKADEKERGFTLDFAFPQKFANHLIGKGGSNIRELREKFDVDIQVQDGKVELKGPKAKAEAAKTHILALGRQLQDEATHILKIDPQFHRALIGAQGAQINRLQTRYKVLIFFPRTQKVSNDDESVAEASDVGKPRRQQAADEVIVRGPKRGADEARDELLSLLQYLKDTSYTATVTVQQKQIPSLIGSGGAALDALRNETKAVIDIPAARDTADGLVEIQIKGTKEAVAAAKKALEAKKAVFEDTVVKTIEVDRKYHRSLIGAGGSTIRDIVVKAGGSDDRREIARAVQFPKQDNTDNTIKIEGRTSVVDNIIQQIEAIVAERQNQITEVIEVPVEKHRSLIGRGGDVKRDLESQFKVSIDVPRQGSGQTGVKIVGQSADVEKAKAHIETLTKDQPGETLQVPRALHHSVSNNGQIFRRLKSDHHVTIDHAGHSIPAKPAASASLRANGGSLPLITDDEESTADAHSWTVVDQTSTEEGDIPWVIRGNPENIEKAKKVIENAIEQAKKEDAIGYLILPDPRTYRYVIGQGGAKVNQIRKQSGCKITVPRDQAKGEAIEVVGTKEGVEKAKDLILAAVKEGQNASRSPRE